MNSSEEINGIVVQIDETKEDIQLDGLKVYSSSLVNHLYEVTFAPPNSQHICHIEKMDYGYVKINWAPYFHLIKDRINFNFTNGLQSLIQYTHKQYIHAHLDIVFATLEQIRTKMKANNVFFVGFPCTGVYMIENEPNVLIGVTGEIGCGKSTIVDYLSKNYKFTEYTFAGPLKNIAVCLGFESHQVFGTQEQKLEINDFWGISGRQFLQVFGSEICRDFVPKVLPQMKLNGISMWVRLFEKFKQDHQNTNLAVSDVRFEDESKTIQQHGGIILRIIRPVQNTSDKHDLINSHQSETQTDLINPNVIIYNDRDLNTLYKKLDLFMEFIRRGIISTEMSSLTI